MLAVVVALLLGGCADPGEPGSSEPRPGASSSDSSTAAPSAEPGASARSGADGVPTSLRLPDLDLDEPLVDLGIGEDGELEVPEDPADVGWFTGGGRPGGPGPTVVVGHVDSTAGPAVFARLPDLGPGDTAVVELDDGREVRYRVESVRDVPQQPFPTEEVFGATPGDVLRLITCTGPYDRDAGRYTENRVVEAVAVG